jgi:hypothetical protein
MRKSVLLALVAAAAALLVGCSDQTPEPATTSRATSELTLSTSDQIALTGTGKGAQKVAVPDGARSIDVDIVCAAPARYTVSTGSAFEFSLRGECEKDSSIVLPIPEYGTIVVDVEIDDGSIFSLTGMFEEDDLAPDPSIAAQCAELSKSSTFIHNAEDGFRRGEIDGAEWTALVAQASAAMESVPTKGSRAITEQLPALSAAYAHADLAPGAFWSPTPAEGYWPAADVVAVACDQNDSPITVQAAYGG